MLADSNHPSPQPLAQLSTIWTLVQNATGGPLAARESAQVEFLQRYQGAVYRYFLTALRDPEAALDLFQEFALRFVRGDFRNADPERGRFRNFLKVALANLIRDDRRRRQVRSASVPLEDAKLGDANADDPQLALAFDRSWSDEILARTWQALLDHEAATGQPFHSVLKSKVEHPQDSSESLAERLHVARPEKPALNEVAFRKTLQRAREKFADILLFEVASTLPNPRREELELELIELGLLTYCGPALDRWPK